MIAHGFLESNLIADYPKLVRNFQDFLSRLKRDANW